MAAPFDIPMSNVWGSNFSISLPTLLFSGFGDCSQLRGCEVVSHGGFDSLSTWFLPPTVWQALG